MEATIVSVYPFQIQESKPGLIPGVFTIPAVTDPDKNFETLLVKDGLCPMYIDMDRGSIRMPTLGNEVAGAVVFDFIVAHLGYQMGVAQPGLFVLEGKVSKDEVKTKYADKLSEARQLQRVWFERLVLLADDEWSKYHMHRSINDVQRFAAKYLGLKREWLTIPEPKVEMMKCPLCKSAIDPEAAICPICRTVVKKEIVSSYTASLEKK